MPPCRNRPTLAGAFPTQNRDKGVSFGIRSRSHKRCLKCRLNGGPSCRKGRRLKRIQELREGPLSPALATKVCFAPREIMRPKRVQPDKCGRQFLDESIAMTGKRGIRRDILEACAQRRQMWG